MNALLLVSSIALGVAGPSEGHDHHSPQLGTLAFETSCTDPARTRLVEGLGWLHSFEYAEAARSFNEAAAADPNCGIAFWGVAMSYYHPLWAPPTPEELAKAHEALSKARSVPPATQRERDYLAAIETFYRGSDTLDHKTRVLAYMSAMADLHKRYPADNEAAVFYALALIAGGTLDNDPNFAREKEAGAILNAVLRQEPQHPGVAHYLIHSFDYPPLAELALPAAQRYASIAPDSAHAQHMPSHIFTRLGLWDESIRSNGKAEAAARNYAQATGMPGAWDQRLHAMDYLAYAYLQTGRDSDAEKVLRDLEAIPAADPASPTTAYAVTAIPARLSLERRRWAEAAQLTLPTNLAGLTALSRHQWAMSNILFANAVGAARSGEPARAREGVQKLAGLESSLSIKPGDYDWRKQISIQRQTAQAWTSYAEGKRDEALRLMRAAADLDDATEKHPVTPGAILPAREQLGELMLELDMPVAALTEFESSLKRAPRRLVGLYGAAHAAKLAGNLSSANRYFAELADVTKGSDGTRSEIKEARSVIAQVAGR